MSSPFQTLKLTAQEQQQCHDCTFQLLDRTLRSYDERDGQTENGPSYAAPRHHSNLDNTRWKLLKTQSHASFYKGRGSCMLQDQNLLGGEWENPIVLLLAGTIQGDLDEIMLGIEITDSNSFRTRTQLFTKQPVVCAILTESMGPTKEDPFRFLGVTWMMYTYNWPLKTLIRSRDYVTVAATGTMVRSNGDRIGYEVVQSIQLSQCPPLSESTVRGKVMYAVIFKQQDLHVVDVFVLTYVETQGLFVDSLVANSTWTSLSELWNTEKLAEMKKIQWCLNNCRSDRQREQRQAPSLVLSVCKHCQNRRSSLSLFNGGAQDEKESCVLCTTQTCSKCRVKRRLVSERDGKLTDQLVIVCQPCMAFVQKLQPAEIAALSYKQRRQKQASS